MLITAAGTVDGWGLARRRFGARALDALTVFSFVMPAAVLGVGLIAAWNRPATQLVYSGPAILVIGYLARYAVIGARPIFAAVSQTSSHLEDAAAVAGGGFARRFARIVVPIHGRALAAACVLAMVFCLRDFETAVLYYPPGGEPLTVRIFTLEANGPPAVVAALAIIHASVTAVVLAGGIALVGRRR
jgi:iron(III) transport system permease protein